MRDQATPCSLLISFKTSQQIFQFPPELFFKPTLSNYTTLFDEVFTKSFFNSIYTSVLATIFGLAVGVPGAFALSRANFKDMYWTIAQMLTHHSSNGCAMQPGDLPATCADVTALSREIGFAPKTRIETGIPAFVEWYKAYHRN